jgi:8-oxo-dGTP pyrophosphatase MutT (NUDIX family)
MPAVPVPAATVILLRDASPSPEVLLIERHAKSQFLPDMYVFPGGRVDEDDASLADRVGGLSAGEAAARLGEGLAPSDALAFYVAAIRETFEESGVLLARRRGKPELLDPATAHALSRHRLEVQEGRVTFREIVQGSDLELACDLLAAHGHWITPEMVPQRFDTLFFTALAPAGQLAAHDGVETTDHVWIRPEDALAQYRAGERRMIFPTLCNLETLAGFASAGEALAASRRRPLVPVLPRMVERDGERMLEIRSDAAYPTTFEKIRAERGSAQ